MFPLLSFSLPSFECSFRPTVRQSPAFPLRTLNMWFYCLLASAAAAEKSCLPHIGSLEHNLLFVLRTPLILSLLSLMFHCDTTGCGFNYISFAQDFFLFIFHSEVSFISSNLLIISSPPSPPQVSGIFRIFHFYYLLIMEILRSLGNCIPASPSPPPYFSF